VHPLASTAWPAGQRQASRLSPGPGKLPLVTVGERQGARDSAARGARFTAVMTAIVGRLPFGLAALRWVVFRDTTQHPAPAPTPPGNEVPGGQRRAGPQSRER